MSMAGSVAALNVMAKKAWQWAAMVAAAVSMAGAVVGCKACNDNKHGQSSQKILPVLPLQPPSCNRRWHRFPFSGPG